MRFLFVAPSGLVQCGNFRILDEELIQSLVFSLGPDLSNKRARPANLDIDGQRVLDSCHVIVLLLSISETCKVKEVISARLLLTPAYMLAGSPAHTVTAGAIRMRDLAVADAKVCAA